MTKNMFTQNKNPRFVLRGELVGKTHLQTELSATASYAQTPPSLTEESFLFTGAYHWVRTFLNLVATDNCHLPEAKLTVFASKP